jgi:small-conductance mechanosensitive channel
MIGRLFNKLPAWMRKLMPTIVLLVLAIIAGATDVFSVNVQDFVQNTLKAKVMSWIPILVDLLIAGVVFNLAWLLHDPLKRMAEKAFERSHASDRGKQLGMKAVILVFWAVVIFFITSMFASELMGKFVLGFSVLGAALTLAMQGAANDFICGVLMQFSCRLREGDDIKTIGMDVEGKVRSVGYLSTTVESADGVISVPNRKIWESALKVKKAPPSKIIIPSGSWGSCRKDK